MNTFLASLVWHPVRSCNTFEYIFQPYMLMYYMRRDYFGEHCHDADSDGETGIMTTPDFKWN